MTAAKKNPEPVSDLGRLCQERGVTIECAYSGTDTRKQKGGKAWACYSWAVTLSYQGRHLTTPFYCGLGWVEPKLVSPGRVTKVDRPKAPTAADVLSGLLSDASCGSETFEDFCSNMGGDTDSRSDLETYLACQAMAPKVRRLLGADFQEFSQAEH